MWDSIGGSEVIWTDFYDIFVLVEIFTTVCYVFGFGDVTESYDYDFCILFEILKLR